jgi:dinuclear metal center YbgI/SA1388 family protein
VGQKKKRIAHLLLNEINLFAYHLPLDCHAFVGNNAQLAHRLQLENAQLLAMGTIKNLLGSAELAEALNPQEFQTILTEKLHQTPIHINGGERPIKKIIWCTGAAQDYLKAAYDLGADAYISGEVSERTYYEAKELGIHYYACGHHATERYGIQALGEHIAEAYHLKHVFIDSDNPI